MSDEKILIAILKRFGISATFTKFQSTQTKIIERAHLRQFKKIKNNVMRLVYKIGETIQKSIQKLIEKTTENMQNKLYSAFDNVSKSAEKFADAFNNGINNAIKKCLNCMKEQFNEIEKLKLMLNQKL